MPGVVDLIAYSSIKDAVNSQKQSKAIKKYLSTCQSHFGHQQQTNLQNISKFAITLNLLRIILFYTYYTVLIPNDKPMPENTLYSRCCKLTTGMNFWSAIKENINMLKIIIPISKTSNQFQILFFKYDSGK